MRERAYYQNPYASEFTETVTSCVKQEHGWAIELTNTLFYPEGGGQPCDLGTLNGISVSDVKEIEGKIKHICAEPIEVGSRVTGKIDWSRRFSFMQQHSGEHIVSGLIHAEYGYENVGFHMGRDAITIDFNGMIDPVGLKKIENRANEVIWKNLEIEQFYPTEEERKELCYRSKKELLGEVRLVRIPGVDLCACCGTHVAHTGEIGLILLLNCVKFHSGVRIEMLCGDRALAWIQSIRAQNHEVSVMLSAKPRETAAAVARMSAELQTAKIRASELEQNALSNIAGQCAGKGTTVLFESSLMPASVRKLCELVFASCGGDCAVFSGDDTAGYAYAVASHRTDIREFCSALNRTLNGRGGGKGCFVQGTLNADRAEIEGFLSAQGFLQKRES